MNKTLLTTLEILQSDKRFKEALQAVLNNIETSDLKEILLHVRDKKEDYAAEDVDLWQTIKIQGKGTTAMRNRRVYLCQLIIVIKGLERVIEKKLSLRND